MTSRKLCPSPTLLVREPWWRAQGLPAELRPGAAGSLQPPLLTAGGREGHSELAAEEGRARGLTSSEVRGPGRSPDLSVAGHEGRTRCWR